MLSLVRSYISTTNFSKSNIDPSLTSVGMNKSSLKAVVTSAKDFQVAHAVFFPLPPKEGVKAWKTGSVRHCAGVIVAIIS